MSTAQEQVTRLLAMIPYVQARPGVAVDQVAEAFEISARQVIQDLKIAWMCGLPGGLPGDLIELDMDAVEGTGRIHLRNADYLQRPLRFTVDEAMSLVVALRVVAELTSGASVVAVESALAKLEALTESDAVRRVAITVDSGHSDIREQVTSAIVAGQRISLRYDGVTRGVTTTPSVDPVRIDLLDGVAYLQAWSLERCDWRTYRLERVGSVQVEGPADDHGPAPQPRHQWFDQVSSDNWVTLALAPAASWIVEYFPSVETPSRFLKHRRRGEELATFPVADPAWLGNLLLRLGDEARVISPVEASLSARERAQAGLELAQRVFGPDDATEPAPRQEEGSASEPLQL